MRTALVAIPAHPQHSTGEIGTLERLQDHRLTANGAGLGPTVWPSKVQRPRGWIAAQTAAPGCGGARVPPGRQADRKIAVAISSATLPDIFKNRLHGMFELNFKASNTM